MIQKIFSYVINALYIVTILFVVVMITTTAFVRKTNLFLQSQHNQVKGNVIKQDAPIIASQAATIKDFLVQNGQHVQAGETLFDWFINQNSSSIQLQAVTAPVSGTVKLAGMQEGTKIGPGWKIIDIYQDDNPKLLVYVSDKQYAEIKKQTDLQAYSERLDQAFTVTPKILDAEVQTNGNAQEKIGVYFEFREPKYATSLLQNEPLTLILPQQQTITLKDLLDKFNWTSK